MEGDLDLIAHDGPTRFQQGVPLEPKLHAAEGGLDREPCPLLPVRVGDLSLELHLQRYCLCNVAYGEVTRSPPLLVVLSLDAGAAEGDVRELLCMKEVVRAQVRVALGL